MEKTLLIENKTLCFRFMEHTDCWQAQAVIDQLETEIVIDLRLHREKEIDWDHFSAFFSFIAKEGRFRKLIKDAGPLVSALGKAFFRESDEIPDYKMEFAHSIIYHGRTDGSFIKDGYSWSLIFDYIVKKNGNIYGDEYGMYLVEIENHFITGTRRLQL